MCSPRLSARPAQCHFLGVVNHWGSLGFDEAWRILMKPCMIDGLAPQDSQGMLSSAHELGNDVADADSALTTLGCVLGWALDSMAGCCGGSVRSLSNTDIFWVTLSVILKQVVSQSGQKFPNIVKHSGIFLFFCLCHMNTTGSLVPIGTCIQGTTCRQDGI